MTGRLITLGLVVACWPLWWFSGWLADQAGISDLDVLLRILFVIASLSVAEIFLARALKNPTIH